ncbi:MAG: LysR family transcriptional regulator [Pseudomonadota bacterium]
MASLDQIDLNSLTIFDVVVDAGSFTAAAERLGVAKAKISVQVARLEQQLGVTLFARTTRRMTLTDAGRALHAHCQPLLRKLVDALAEAGSEHGQLRGLLRLSTTVVHAAQSVAPALAQFAALHPDLKIELRTGDRIADMVKEGIDLSFRMGWLRDSTQRAILLEQFRQYVIAAPAYLARRGTPHTPQELAAHDWIGLSLLPTPHTWTFAQAGAPAQTVHVKSRIEVDAPSALLALLVNGAGVSAMEEFTAQAAIDAGTLVHLLPDWSLPTGGVYAVLPPGRYVPARVRAFIDFYRDYLARTAKPAARAQTPKRTKDAR